MGVSSAISPSKTEAIAPGVGLGSKIDALRQAASVAVSVLLRLLSWLWSRFNSKEEGMRVFAASVVALCLIASPVMAGANGAGGNAGADPNAAPTSTANADSSTPAKPETVTADNELQQLKDLLEAQAKQLQEQQQELKEQQAEMQALKQQISGSSSTNSGALAAAPVATPAVAAIGPVLGVSTANAAIGSATPAPANAQTAPTDQPASIHYKGITLTPGGFSAAETVWRQKAMASDVNTPFNSVPFDGASAAHMSEFNASGRQSRISMLMQGKLANVTIGSYYEADFLSAGTTSNNNQSNSYTLRQRQFWGQAAFSNGVTITGGQQWSLITETANGMDNRTENLPMTIDAQYHAGFSWARQYGIRFVKNFGNKVWLGASVEESQATLSVSGNPTVSSGGTTFLECANAACTSTTSVSVNQTVNNNFLLGAFGTSGGLYNPLGNYQFNPAPDVIAKAVFQPGFGHYEVFGVLSSFRDRVFPCVPITGTTQGAGCPTGSPTTSALGAYNDSREGGGVGGNARWTVLNKKVDFGVHFFGGSGIGRYGSVGLSDATTRPDGTLALLRNYQALGTLQLHPVPKLDIYFNVGGEYSARAQYIKSGTIPNEGYGALGFNNSGCYTETLPVTGPGSTNTGVPTGVGGSTGFIPGSLSNCSGNTRNLIEGTVGFWYRFYNGPMGRVQFGMQYSSYVRNTWDGNGGTATNPLLSPSAGQNMWFTSFRYYLP
jgi:hypothetical protein